MAGRARGRDRSGRSEVARGHGTGEQQPQGRREDPRDVGAGAIDRIRSPSISTVASSTGALPVPSITVAPTMA
jgi:hypothetical protein